MDCLNGTWSDTRVVSTSPEASDTLYSYKTFIKSSYTLYLN